MTYQQRFERARRAQVGEVWTHRKTGRKVKVIFPNVGLGIVRISRETGRLIWRTFQYLASDYNPPEK